MQKLGFHVDFYEEKTKGAIEEDKLIKEDKRTRHQEKRDKSNRDR